MIIPDANLLLYAYDASSPFHNAAAAWWSSCLSGRETIGLSAPVVFAFVRIGTSRRAFDDPLSLGEACDHVESWLRQPVVQLIETDRADVVMSLDLLRTTGGGGNLATDAQLAAMAHRFDAVVHSADSDFARFPALKWRNPLQTTK